MVKTVYCDESGFTGENLLQEEQPYFVYSAVAIDEDEAEEIVKETIERHRIKATELKAGQLLKRPRGRQAMMDVVGRIVPNSSVAVFHKRYSLAGKMFEYLIEPAISSGSSLFYDIGFHKFVANGLYMGLHLENMSIEDVFAEFQEMMRTGDVERLNPIIAGLSQDDISSFFGQVGTIVACNQRLLHPEITTSGTEHGPPRYLLELTMTALMSLLATHSGAGMEPLKVVCDSSKPLLAQAQVFDGFVGRDDYHEMNFDGRVNQVTFSLAEKIEFADSTKSAGLQLADVVAGAAAFSLKNPDDEFSAYWRDHGAVAVHPNSVVPDASEFDLSNERSVINAFVLNELAQRSVSGRFLVQEMRQFIEFAGSEAPKFLLQQAD